MLEDGSGRAQAFVFRLDDDGESNEADGGKDEGQGEHGAEVVGVLERAGLGQQPADEHTAADSGQAARCQPPGEELAAPPGGDGLADHLQKGQAAEAGGD